MVIASIQGDEHTVGEVSRLKLNEQDCTCIRFAKAAEQLSWRQVANFLVNSSSFRQF